jgi:hypothetical protein
MDFFKIFITADSAASINKKIEIFKGFYGRVNK